MSDFTTAEQYNTLCSRIFYLFDFFLTFSNDGIVHEVLKNTIIIIIFCQTRILGKLLGNTI